MPHPCPLPEPLLSHTQNPRVTVRRAGPPLPGGKCVVYWMQRTQRALDNPALDLAISLGNELNLPIVVFSSIIANYPSANLRHYAFLNQGLHDIASDLAARNVAFIVRRPPDNQLEKFLAEVQAAVVIGDENHCREPERWRKVLARRLRLPFLTVDADVVVPSSLFDKHFYALHIFKPRLFAHLPTYLVPQPNHTAAHSWHTPKNFLRYDLRGDITHGWTSLDRTVPPVDTFTGGTSVALRRLNHFVTGLLHTYPEKRNHPELDGTSCLSPYLHFGHISPITIALAAQRAVQQGQVSPAACDAFLGELIGWRELSINFVRHIADYDSLDCAPNWAAKTLREHTHDTRPTLYTLQEMEQAHTHDDLWNAAQLQMVRHGWMHNRMRMYWAKKILEWSPSPHLAYQHAVLLNDRYELDGRDPNGYAGIAWSIAGVHDRPWFDRSIFGTIRYMSGESTGRKFNS
ncbi:MAG TPA: deoxyribodipyrimidine photo-lyase, partial [Terracidiphilus sp.]